MAHAMPILPPAGFVVDKGQGAAELPAKSTMQVLLYVQRYAKLYSCSSNVWLRRPADI